MDSADCAAPTAKATTPSPSTETKSSAEEVSAPPPKSSTSSPATIPSSPIATANGSMRTTRVVKPSTRKTGRSSILSCGRIRWRRRRMPGWRSFCRNVRYSRSRISRRGRICRGGRGAIRGRRRIRRVFWGDGWRIRRIGIGRRISPLRRSCGEVRYCIVQHLCL